MTKIENVFLLLSDYTRMHKKVRKDFYMKDQEKNGLESSLLLFPFSLSLPLSLSLSLSLSFSFSLSYIIEFRAHMPVNGSFAFICSLKKTLFYAAMAILNFRLFLYGNLSQFFYSCLRDNYKQSA